MKKTALFCTILCAVSSLTFAYNIDIPHRFIEFGFDASAGASNNAFGIKDVLVKDLVIDLTDLADSMPDAGFLINANAATAVYFNVDLKNGLHIGGKTGIETNGIGGVSKDLFDFLGHGNSAGKEINFNINTDFDVFLYTQAELGFNVKGFRFYFEPAAFHPVLHAETTDSKAFFTNGTDGSVKAGVQTTINAWSMMNLEPIIEDKSFNFSDLPDELKNGWGFDLAFSIEHRILASLQGRAYMRVPLVPGSMDYKATLTYQTLFEVLSIQDLINDFNKDDSLSDFSEKTYGEEKKSLSRPFRTGVELAWRPFGKYITFGAQAGLAVKYPYTSQATVYPEYELSSTVTLLNFIGVSVASKYQSEVFIHQAGVILNARVIELDAGVSVQGGSFEQSFHGSGAGAYISLKAGF